MHNKGSGFVTRVFSTTRNFLFEKCAKYHLSVDCCVPVNPRIKSVLIKIKVAKTLLKTNKKSYGLLKNPNCFDFLPKITSYF